MPTTGPYAQQDFWAGRVAPTYAAPSGALHMPSGQLFRPNPLPACAGHSSQRHTGTITYTDQTGLAAENSRGEKRTSRWLAALLAILLLLIAGGGGVLAYVLTRLQSQPQPVISLASTYSLGKTPVGSKGATLHLHGLYFAGNSAITFLLDNHPAPGAPHVASDAQGTVNADLPVTSAWPLGLHTLSIKDAAHHASKRDIQVKIVAPGQANTPGPNGAPSDDASFVLNVTVQGQYSGDSAPMTGANTLLVTGHADPAGGSVCKDRDDGQPQTYHNTTASGMAETLVYTFSCAGTYKNGQISYTETLLSALVTVDDQGNTYTCHLLTPGVDEQLSGSYTASGGFSGTLTASTFPQSDFACSTGQLAYFHFSLAGGDGTWSAHDEPAGLP